MKGSFSRNKTPCAFRWRFFHIALITFTVSGQAWSQTTLKAYSNLLNAEAPISFPEALVVTPQGNIYVLDTNLSTLFAVEMQTGKLKRICGADKLAAPVDIAVDGKGNLWVLSVLHSKILKLTHVS